MAKRSTPRMPHPADIVKRILVITLSNIGDAIMTTPVLEALHGKHPRAWMDIVTDPRSSELFSHCPYRERIIQRDKQLGWRGSVSMIRQLRQCHYDLIVDLRTDGLAWLLRGRRRLTRWGNRRAGGHAVERHMHIIRSHEDVSGTPPVRTWYSTGETGVARDLLAGLPGKRWLALGPGARWAPKRWPATHFSRLLEHLGGQFDALVLLGGEEDAHQCRYIAARSTRPCLNLAGKTSLLEAGAVLARTQVFVGNDSGLGHLAAAVNIPVITLFGPGDPHRYHPWTGRGRWIQSASGRIEDIRPARVATVVSALLARSPYRAGDGTPATTDREESK